MKATSYLLLTVVAVLAGCASSAQNAADPAPEQSATASEPDTKSAPVKSEEPAPDQKSKPAVIQTLPGDPHSASARVRIIPGPPQVEGPLDHSTVRRVLRKHRHLFWSCAEEHAKDYPEVNGKLVVSLDVAKSGKVSAASVESTTVENDSLETCIVDAMRTWTFPNPEQAAAKVEYTMNFSAP